MLLIFKLNQRWRLNQAILRKLWRRRRVKSLHNNYWLMLIRLLLVVSITNKMVKAKREPEEVPLKLSNQIVSLRPRPLTISWALKSIVLRICSAKNRKTNWKMRRKSVMYLPNNLKLHPPNPKSKSPSKKLKLLLSNPIQLYPMMLTLRNWRPWRVNWRLKHLLPPLVNYLK
jgi:hypothetical protein